MYVSLTYYICYMLATHAWFACIPSHACTKALTRVSLFNAHVCNTVPGTCVHLATCNGKICLHTCVSLHIHTRVCNIAYMGGTVIAKCLSMRHIILRGRRVPTVEYAVCIYIYIFIYLFIYRFVQIYGSQR